MQTFFGIQHELMQPDFPAKTQGEVVDISFDFQTQKEYDGFRFC